MPNGGESEDCCLYCGYNRAFQEYGLPDIGEEERYLRSTYCTLRNVPIWGHPFSTYCANYVLNITEACPEAKIKGPITKRAPCTEREDYSVLIPWFENVEPLVSARVRCEICQRKSHKGIRLDMPDGRKIGFCSKEHYMQWLSRLVRNPDCLD